MSYANNYNKNRNYRQNFYRWENGNQGEFHQPTQRKKHSGAKYKSSTNSGEPCIIAWNYSTRLGLVKMIASPKLTHTTTGLTGKSRSKSDNARKTSNPNWELWNVKLQLRDGVKWFLGFFNINSKKLIIKDLQMVINPSAPNGGYAGRFYKSKN